MFIRNGAIGKIASIAITLLLVSGHAYSKGQPTAQNINDPLASTINGLGGTGLNGLGGSGIHGLGGTGVKSTNGIDANQTIQGVGGSGLFSWWGWILNSLRGN